MKNLCERETAGNGPAITGGEAGASPAMRTPRRTGGMKTALPRALRLVCVLASLAPLAGCELGFGSVLHKPPSGGDDGGNGGEPGQRYSITYYLNGGTFGSAAAPSAYTQDSLPLTLPEPERAGCEFSGWYDNEDLTGSPVTSIPKSSTGDKTFWAKWREIPYTITLHLNGGDLLDASGWSKAGDVYTKTYTISSPDITLPEAAYPGNPSFGGWYTDETLLDRAEPPEVPEGSAEDMEFYARYPFTVTFDSNGGSAVPGITALGAGAKITEPAPPVKDGFDFGGWYKTNTDFNNQSNKWDFAADKVGNSDITLYAKWEKIPTITLHLKGGDLSDDDKDDWGAKGGNSSDYTYTREYTESDLPITLPEPVPAAGCSFIGWFTDAACAISAGSPPVVVPKDSTGDKEFWAKWEEIPYTITLHLNGGGLPSGSGWSGPKADSAASDYVYTLTYTVSSPAIPLPAAPVSLVTGYGFGGWFTDEDCAVSAGTPPEVPGGGTGNKTFYAKWEEIPYTITLHLNGGGLPSGSGWSGPRADSAASDYVYTKTYTISSPAITLPEPVPTAGYSFAGWFTNDALTASAGTPPVVVSTGSTGGKTFWAKWEEIPYTITLHLNGGDLPDGHNWGTQGGSAGDYTYTMTYTVSSPAITLPPAPVCSGQFFGGWFTDADISAGTPPEIPTGSTGGKTFWAKWEDPWFYRGTPDTGTPIDISGRSGSTRIDKAKTYLAASGEADTLYTLVLDSGFSQTPVTLSGLAASGITLVVTTRDDTEREVTLSANGSLFTVGANSGSAVTLRLDRSVTLRGKSGNNSPLVQVNAAGTLEAEGNAKITGNNTSSSLGGGVLVNGGTFTLSGSGSVSGNSASSAGGVLVLSGTFTMSGGSVSGNSASSRGGGVRVASSGGIFTMNGGSVSGNSASSGEGGGVYNGGTFTMSGGSVQNNTASSDGGGVFVNTGTFTMSGSASVSGNSATSYGGGVYVRDSGTFTLNGGRIQGGADDSGGFTKNTASSGAALYKSSGTAKFGAASTGCAVGSTGKNAGDDIGTTSETITATGP